MEILLQQPFWIYWSYYYCGLFYGSASSFIQTLFQIRNKTVFLGEYSNQYLFFIVDDGDIPSTSSAFSCFTD